MYLKSIEMLGFKSFANKTKLEFEPGMTAIVGPNGCGKSNIADAFRWVLGEQSAKALRAGKMEDVIFNGTDARKPLGMAEVSITFADCEKQLGTEFHEVTVTRRVFRSGEGQYFMNKTPCRLKDIQRLFMDTGIGTTSYSFMEQGRIDQILSSRPEDRRTVFEEASGITKFKADKREAIRKLEQTEANLLRLADVIREVKRQIGSLQRQAGKARRYKEMRDQLRGYDMVLTRHRMREADATIADLEATIQKMAASIAESHREVEDLEQGSAELRAALVQVEREMGRILEAGVQARSKLDHAQELIQVNRQRIEEYTQLSERDTREIGETRKLIEDHGRMLQTHAADLEKAAAERQQAEKDLQAATDILTSHQQQVESVRAQIQAMRLESVDLESSYFKLQNELVEVESQARASVIRRERLAAEKGQLARISGSYEKRQLEMATILQGLQSDLQGAVASLKSLEDDRTACDLKIRDLQQQAAEIQSLIAGRRTQIAMLTDTSESEGDFPGGARYLMEQSQRSAAGFEGVIGALAGSLDVKPRYATALEAVLRPWFDAVLVKDAVAARTLLAALSAARQGPARLIPLSAGVDGDSLPAAPAGAVRLLDHVKGPESAAPLLNRLLGHVLVVENAEALPAAPAAGFAWVTQEGILLHADGCAEFWMRDARAANPLSRRNLVAEARSSLEDLERSQSQNREAMQATQAELEAIKLRIRDHGAALDEQKRAAAQKEGEQQITQREAKEARQRLETVSWELENLNKQDEAGDTQKHAIQKRMAEVQAQRETNSTGIRDRTTVLHDLESRQTDLQDRATNARIRFAGLSQRTEHLAQQHDALKSRIAELESNIEGRSKGILTYRESIARFEQGIAAAEGQLASLEEAVESNTAKAESLKKSREKQTQELKRQEETLTVRRAALEEVREQRNEKDLRLSETRMRRQNMLDRVTSEYRITVDQIAAEPEPEWEGEPPSLETIETLAAEFRTKIEAMGPVNLVAIDECKELEDRMAFLSSQETDLVNSKQQLIEMIKKINMTTSEMFKSTFDQVNINFQGMFEKLFNGGTAKLVLVNEEDVLECGIEIIARPPGKRLQNVSLLSGGERTMTAVALLFSIYMIKPSPFCMLDELDAALDESNIGRFVKVLQEFVGQSQFVVITHNRQTISASNILYGVTMPEKGISTIVSMRFTHWAPHSMLPQQPAGAPTPAAKPAEEAPAAEPAAEK